MKYLDEVDELQLYAQWIKKYVRGINIEIKKGTHTLIRLDPTLSNLISYNQQIKENFYWLWIWLTNPEKWDNSME